MLNMSHPRILSKDVTCLDLHWRRLPWLRTENGSRGLEEEINRKRLDIDILERATESEC